MRGAAGQTVGPRIELENTAVRRHVLAEQSALCQIGFGRVVFKQRENLIACLRFAIGQQLKLAKIAAIRVDRGTQHIGFHDRSGALHQSGLRRRRWRRVQPLIRNRRRIGGRARGIHRRGRRRRGRMLLLPGFPQQKKREGKDDKKNQPLVIHGTVHYELG